MTDGCEHRETHCGRVKYERESRSEVPFTVDAISARKFRKKLQNISQNDHFSEIDFVENLPRTDFFDQVFEIFKTISIYSHTRRPL